MPDPNGLPGLDENRQFWRRKSALPMVGLLARLGQSNRCILCKYREPDGWLDTCPGELLPLRHMLRRFMAHLKSTHGLEEDVVLTRFEGLEA